MSLVVHRAVHVTVATAAIAAPPGGAPRPKGSALPEPEQPLSDAMAAIYRLLNRQSTSDAASKKADIDVAQAVKKKHLAEEIDALKRKMDAEADGGRGLFGSIGELVGDVASDIAHLRIADAVSDAKDDVAAMDNPAFWHDLEVGAKVVGEVAALVVAAAATVVTFGAAAPALVAVAIVGVSLSAAGMIEENTHALEAAGVDAKVAGWGAAIAQVAGSVMTAGAGSAAGAGAAVDAASAARAGAGAVQGGAHARNAVFQRDADEGAADLAQATNAAGRVERDIRMLLDALKDLEGSNRHAKETLQGALRTLDETSLTTMTRA